MARISKQHVNQSYQAEIQRRLFAVVTVTGLENVDLKKNLRF